MPPRKSNTAHKLLVQEQAVLCASVCTACVRRVYSSMPSYSSARELAHQETASSCPGVDIHPSFPATSPAFQLLRIASASTPSTSVHLSRSRTEHERPRLVNYSRIGFQLAASPSARTHTGTSLPISIGPTCSKTRTRTYSTSRPTNALHMRRGAARHSTAQYVSARHYITIRCKRPRPCHW